MEEKEIYRAGFCNIGNQELAVRKKLFTFSFLVSLVMTWITICYHTHLWVMSLLFGSVFFTILLFIEIRLKFCILFGFFSLHNFHHLGHLDNVENKEYCQKDRAKAFKIVTLALVAAGGYTYLHFLLASYIYS